MGDMQISMRQLQLLELQIAKEIKRICIQNDIRYFLADGSLLGAIRHGGFIPWDDDMDIGMLRPDYEKFLRCASNCLGQGFYLQTWENDHRFALPFAKVRMKGTRITELATEHLNMDSGIWVDIIPFDSLNDKKRNDKVYFLMLQILGKALQIKCGYRLNLLTQNPLSKIVNIILQTVVSRFDKTVVKDVLEKKLLVNEFDADAEYMIECDGLFKDKFVFTKGILENFIEMKFEDEAFCVPLEYDEYLKTCYGNYMELPSVEEQRKGHFLVDIEVEDGIMLKLGGLKE